MARLEAGKLGIDHIWARILSVYGPYDGPNTLISSLIRTLKNGELPKLTQGIQTWDYLYSEDAAEALYLLAMKGKAAKTYVLGSGESRPLKDYIDIVKNNISPEVKLTYGEIPYSEKQVMNLQADISELTKDTGFKPKWMFEDGVRETIEWGIYRD